MIYYNWKQLKTDCKKLSKQIKSLDSNFNTIVAIVRNGLIPATMISNMLGIKTIYTIGYEDPRKIEKVKLEPLTQLYDYVMYRNIILVDSAVNTGKTFLESLNELEKRNNNVLTVSLHYKPNSNFAPHFFAHKTNDWIKYPWECVIKN